MPRVPITMPELIELRRKGKLRHHQDVDGVREKLPTIASKSAKKRLPSETSVRGIIRKWVIGLYGWRMRRRQQKAMRGQRRMYCSNCGCDRVRHFCGACGADMKSQRQKAERISLHAAGLQEREVLNNAFKPQNVNGVLKIRNTHTFLVNKRSKRVIEIHVT